MKITYFFLSDEEVVILKNIIIGNYLVVIEVTIANRNLVNSDEIILVVLICFCCHFKTAMPNLMSILT